MAKTQKISKPSSKKASSTTESKAKNTSTTETKAKRRPKGFVSISLEAAGHLSLQSMWQGYMMAYSRGMTDAEFLKLFENEQWLEEIRPVITQITNQSFLFACCSPFIEEILKNKRANQALMWNYTFVRVSYMASNKLENLQKPSPTENDEIMWEAFQMACATDEEFRNHANQYLQRGEDHFWDWYHDQREECIQEFRRLFKKHLTASKVFLNLAEKLGLEIPELDEFDKK